MNFKSLCAFLAFVSLLIALMSAVRFGVDLWRVIEGSKIAQGKLWKTSLNLPSIGGILCGIIMLVFSLICIASERIKAWSLVIAGAIWLIGMPHLKPGMDVVTRLFRGSKWLQSCHLIGVNSMEVAISPELERLVNEQVETGRFASPAEVFEASLRQMMKEDDFDEQDLADFEEAERDIAAGRVHTVQELRREFLGE